MLRDPIFYLLLAGLLLPPFIGTTIFFHQGHLIEVRGYDRLAFAGAFPVMAISTVFFGLLCGALIDRFGAVRLLPFFLAPMFVACVAAAAIADLSGIYVFMFVLGISYGLTNTLMGALWPEIYGTAHLGAIRSIFVSAMVLATALGPGITGLLIDRGVNLPEQLWWMALWCALSTVALVFAGRHIARRLEAERQKATHTAA